MAEEKQYRRLAPQFNRTSQYQRQPRSDSEMTGWEKFAKVDQVLGVTDRAWQLLAWYATTDEKDRQKSYKNLGLTKDQIVARTKTIKDAMGGSAEILSKGMKLLGKTVDSKFTAAKEGLKNINLLAKNVVEEGIDNLPTATSKAIGFGAPEVKTKDTRSMKDKVTGLTNKVKGLLAGYPNATPEQLKQIKAAEEEYFAKNKDGSYTKMISVSNPQGGSSFANEQQRKDALDTRIKDIMGQFKESQKNEVTTYVSDLTDTGNLKQVLPQKGNY